MKEEILKLYNEGKKPNEISQIMNCSIGTVYWHISKKTRESILTNRRKRRKENKNKIKNEIFRGKCCLCGYDKSLSALDFHHTDKNKKEFLISKLMGEGNIGKLQTELKKVILVCKNCHCEIHDGMHKNLPKSLYKGESLYSDH